MLTVLLILGGIQIYFSYYLDDYLKETVVTRFNTATENAYDLKTGDFDLGILGRQLNISAVTLQSKKEEAGTNIQAAVDEITFSGIGFLNILFRQSLNISQMEVINPRLSVTMPDDIEAKNKKEKWITISRRLSELALQEFDNISIPNLTIRGLSLDYGLEDLSVYPIFSFENSRIRFYDFEIDSTFLQERRIFPSGNMEVTFRDIRYQTPSELYELSASQLYFSSVAGTMNIDSVELTPKYDKQQFAKKVGYETDRMTISIDHINWKSINSEQLNRAQGLSSRHIALQNGDIDIYRDKRLSYPPNRQPPLPQEIIRNIPFPISVDSISLINSKIRYSERAPQSTASGSILFANTSATIKNVYNNQDRWQEGNYPTLRAETDIMGKARLTAEFSFPMADSSNKQLIKGNLQPLDMQTLNKALVPLASVRIDDGQILGMDFDMTLGEQQAEGEVILQYENLKISMLNEKSNKEEFANKISSLLANTFKIKSDNKGDELRIGKVDFEREEEKSTFNYWWKSLLSGLQSSIGL